MTGNSYPIRTVSRSVTKKRTRRMAWFIVGTAFGVGCTSALTPIFTASDIVIAQAPVVSEPLPTPFVETEAAQPAAIATEAYVTPALAEIASEEVISSADLAQESSDEALYPLSMDLKVQNGDTLISMLVDAGVSSDEAQNAMSAVKKRFDPKKLGIGQNITVEIDKLAGTDQPVIKSMSIPISVASSLELDRDNAGGFNVKKVDAELDRRLARVGGKINSSLYKTGTEIGLPRQLVGEIINAYSYDIDFQRDIQDGDTIDVLYEKLQTKEGKTAGHGNLIFAELQIGDRELKVYRYADKDGNADYYNAAGESIRKALLRTPINGARISSGYGQRKHPILGYNKMHRGVDFAAPTGTPIYAAGDGVVEFAGRKGGYGNFLKIKHNDKYASGYAHLSRFASLVAPGKKVKQGQIIAYVGSTGASTGPHLHYEIFVNGEQVNPSGVKFKTGNVLKGKELANFRQTISKIEAKLETIPRGSSGVAMADFERDIKTN